MGHSCRATGLSSPSTHVQWSWGRGNQHIHQSRVGCCCLAAWFVLPCHASRACFLFAGVLWRAPTATTHWHHEWSGGWWQVPMGGGAQLVPAYALHHENDGRPRPQGEKWTKQHTAVGNWHGPDQPSPPQQQSSSNCGVRARFGNIWGNVSYRKTPRASINATNTSTREREGWGVVG